MTQEAMTVSIETRSARGQIRMGTLLHDSLCDAADYITGAKPWPDFPDYLKRRGRRDEELAFDAGPPMGKMPYVAPEHRNMTGTLETSRGRVVLHPDYVHVEDDVLEIGEIVGGLDANDEKKIEGKLEQALSYIGALALGARLDNMNLKPLEEYREVRARVIVVGLWDLDSEAHPVMLAVARKTGQNLVTKAEQLDRLIAGELSREDAEAWDKEHPVVIKRPEPPPILKDEEGRYADEYIQGTVALKRLTEDLEILKERFHNYLVATKQKSVRAPGGGSITLAEKTVEELNPEAYEELGGPDVDAQLVRAEQAVEALFAKVRTSKEAITLGVLRQKRADLLNQASTKTKKPWHVRANPPRGSKKGDAEA